MIKKYMLIFVVSCNLYAAGESELIMRMSKDFESKEIISNPTICKEYNILYSALSIEEQHKYEKLDCCMKSAINNLEEISDEYLAEIDNTVSFVKNSSRKISDNEDIILIQQFFNNVEK